MQATIQSGRNEEPAMSKTTALIRRPGRGLRGQGGFTLVSLVIGTIIGGVVMTGAWLAYADMQSEMHVLNAERQMDQYAHAAFQELTNLCSWSWAGVQLQGGTTHPRWKFLTQDIPREFGTRLKYTPDQEGFVTLSFSANQGILINNRAPAWASDQYRNMYVWSGQNPRAGEIRIMDRRDRMTVESMSIDYANSRWIDVSMQDSTLGKGAIMVSMTMQYRYRSEALFGLYPRDYVRERTYATQIYMRNWDSDVNEFRKRGGI